VWTSNLTAIYSRDVMAAAVEFYQRAMLKNEAIKNYANIKPGDQIEIVSLVTKERFTKIADYIHNNLRKKVYDTCGEYVWQWEIVCV